LRDRDFEYDDLDDDSIGEDGDSSDAVTMPCPHCFGTIYDDSERCPHCGEYLSREDLPYRPRLWIVMTVGICLVVVATWIVR
jgi:uncharacterized protein (DUF983 family)